MDRGHPSQAVVAATVGDRLQRQLGDRRTGGLELLRSRRFREPLHGIENHGGADHPGLQGQIAGDLQGFQAILAQLTRHQQQIDKGPIALVLLQEAVSHHFDRHGQIPLLRDAVLRVCVR